MVYSAETSVSEITSSYIVRWCEYQATCSCCWS